jgi:hypothetical protein
MMYSSRTTLVKHFNREHQLEKAATVQGIRHSFPIAGNIYYKKGAGIARYPDPGATLLTSEEEKSQKKEIDKKKGCTQ